MIKTPPANADIWILAGQSNMAGSGTGEAYEEPSENVWLYSLQDQWDIARESFIVDRYSAADEAFAIMRGEYKEHAADPTYRSRLAKIWKGTGAGLGLRFGKSISAFTGRPVGFIHCAKGDTRMEEWTPDYDGPPYMALYQATLRRIRKVNRPVTGILWYQGESDTFDGKALLYVERMKKLVSAFRRDLNQPDLPFFYSQIGTFALQTEEELPDWNTIQTMQRELESVLAPGGMVASVDLPLCDWGHISTAGLKRHGERFAKVVRRRLYGDQTFEVGPRLVKVERDPGSSDRVRIQFDSVNGQLLPKDHIAGFSVFSPGSTRDMVCSAYVSPENSSTVILRTIRPIKPESTVWYGKGLFPYCNLTDAVDLAAPTFGPWTI